MMRNCISLLLLFFPVYASAQSINDRAYSLVADYSINRDKVVGKPYAIIGIVERHKVRKGDTPEIDQSHRYYAKGKDSELVAICRFSKGAAEWSELLVNGDRYRAKCLLRHIYQESEPGQNKMDFIRNHSACTDGQIATLSPFNKVIGVNAVNFYGEDVQLEERLLLKGKLISATQVTQGDLQTVWTHPNTPTQTLEYTITWSNKQGMMPSVIETRSTAGTRFEERVAIDWKQEQDLWLPTNIRAQSLFMTGRQYSHFIKLDWRFGEKLAPQQIDHLFDIGNEDYRVPITELFGHTVDRHGIVGTAFIAPDDLYTGASYQPEK